MSLSPLRKEQRRCLEIAARDGQLVAGPDTPYKLTFCRALVRKGYLEGNLTSKGLTPFTITSAGRQALEEQTSMNKPTDEYLVFISPNPKTGEGPSIDWRSSFNALVQGVIQQGDDFDRMQQEVRHELVSQTRRTHAAEAERDALIALIQSHLDDPNLLTRPVTSDHERRLMWLLHERQTFQQDTQQARAEVERLTAALQEIANYYITPREASVSDIRVLRDMARQALKPK